MKTKKTYAIDFREHETSENLGDRKESNRKSKGKNEELYRIGSMNL
jgi:hypothetical protein